MSQPSTAPWQPNLSASDVSRLGVGVFVSATALLVWGTLGGGRFFGPISFMLRVTPYSDKVGHFLLYGAITFAVAILVRRPVAALIGASVICALGVVDEFRQRSTGARNFELTDIAANTLGVCVGLVVAGILVHFVQTQAQDEMLIVDRVDAMA